MHTHIRIFVAYKPDASKKHSVINCFSKHWALCHKIKNEQYRTKTVLYTLHVRQK